METSINQNRIISREWLIAGATVFVLALSAFWFIRVMIPDDEPVRKPTIDITLFPQQPKPVIKKTPTKPKEKVEMINPLPKAPLPKPIEKPQDPLPKNLGIETDGKPGTSVFNLEGRTGTYLIGTNNNQSMMQRFAWYTYMIQEEIRKRINAYMDKNGGIPQGNNKALIRIVLDAQGRIVDFKLNKPSGSQESYARPS